MFVAVIVTYNRKELLARNIDMLLKQTKQFDRIYIIDNCSTDGTYEYLNTKGWISNSLFFYIRSEVNIGGAGGFYMGSKAAFDDGADWVVLMDDDGVAEDENTFSILFNVANDLYNKNKGNKKLFVNSLVQQDSMLSFKIDDIYTVDDALKIAKNGLIEGAANPFNGTLVSRELIAEIGYPNKDFFIKGDEVNYKHRALEAGAYVCTVVDSRYNHPRPETLERKIFGVKMPFCVEAPWKEYYTARNFTWMYKQSKWYKAIVFELIFVKIIAIFSMKCKKLKTIHMLFKGVFDGWRGNLGAKVKP